MKNKLIIPVLAIMAGAIFVSTYVKSKSPAASYLMVQACETYEPGDWYSVAGSSPMILRSISGDDKSVAMSFDDVDGMRIKIQYVGQTDIKPVDAPPVLATLDDAP